MISTSLTTAFGVTKITTSYISRVLRLAYLSPTIVEAFIRPADVAFLKLGQPATVKLTAYDFNKYGGIAGVLEI